MSHHLRIASFAAAALIATLAALAPGGARAGDGPTLWVDRDSVGGTCSDARGLAEVSRSAPLCTIPRALELAPAGATVEVRAGSYPALTVTGRSYASAVTVEGYGSEAPELAGLTLDGDSGLTFGGFRITDLTHMENVSHVAMVGNDVSPNGIVAGGASDLRFEGNRIHDLTMNLDSAGNCVASRCGFGFRINNATGIVIRGNSLSHIPADGAQLALGISDVLITGNTFDHISPFIDPNEHSDSIQVLGAADRLTISDNLFHDVRGPIVQPGNTGDGGTRGLVIENNALVQLHDWAINLYDTPGARLVGNTAWDGNARVKLTELAAPAPMTDLVAFDNIFYSVSATAGMFAFEDYNLVGSGYRAGPHDLARTPVFVNPATYDYRLAPGSPGIGAGLADGAPATDLWGRPRLPYVDIGALEHSSDPQGAPVGEAGSFPFGEPPAPPSPPAGGPSSGGGTGSASTPSGGTSGASDEPPVTVPPTVAGMRADDARRRLLGSGLAPALVPVLTDRPPAGLRLGDVLTQSGTTLSYYAGVRGARTCARPPLSDLIGADLDVAEAVLRLQGCIVDYDLRATAGGDTAQLSRLGTPRRKHISATFTVPAGGMTVSLVRARADARHAAYVVSVTGTDGRAAAGARLVVDGGSTGAADKLLRTDSHGRARLTMPVASAAGARVLALGAGPTGMPAYGLADTRQGARARRVARHLSRHV